MEIFTAGFTKWKAQDFFATLRAERVDRLVDVRLQNTSQLAGFAKRDDLEYFLHEIVGARYTHEPRLAPSPELFEDYKKKRIGWTDFAGRFEDLMQERKIAQQLTPEDLGPRPLLLCSEHEPDRCHRRLVAEHIAEAWGEIEIIHLPR